MPQHHGHHEHGGCGCGHQHQGEHQHHGPGEACGCGHQHQGEHQHHGPGEACGCGHDHVPVTVPEGLTPRQADILLALCQRRYLPVACFALTKAGDDDRYAVALAPVYLGTPDDGMEPVKQLGEELLALEERALITLDYDLPLQGYPYAEYQTSALYAHFVQTVAEAAQREQPAFDTPLLELGSMALTEAGQALAEGMLG